VFQKVAGVAASLLALASPVDAQLASQTTNFTGTVPAACNVLGGGNQNANLVLTQLDNFQGSSNSISFEANADVNLQLAAVSIVAAPQGTSNYTWLATLNDAGNNVIASADPSNASSLVNYSSGLTNQQTFTVKLSIQPNTSFLIPGTYTADVTLDCLAN